MRLPSPLLAPALAFSLGAALGATGSPYPVGSVALLPAVAVPALSPLAFASAGWLSADLARAGPRAAPADPVELEGSIASVPTLLGDRVRFLLSTVAWGRVEVVGTEPGWPLALGDHVRLRARLLPPSSARNPGGRDSAARLRALGAALEARGIGPIVRVAKPSPLAWLERSRRRWAEATSILPAREAGVLRAIGTGDRAGLDRETSSAFARSGLAHVLAVSGLHLVVVAWGLFRLVSAAAIRVDRLALHHDARRIAACVALPATLVYSLATGAGAPVLRAALGAAAAFVGVLWRRELDALAALSAAALAVLALEPGAILDPSLQLSFAAVAGLALGSQPLRASLPWPRPSPGTWRARLVEPFVEGACASIAASIATAPILAHHFRQVPLLGLAANVAAVPIGTALTALGALGAVAAAAWPPLALPVLYAAWPFARALVALAEGSAAPSWGAIHLARPALALSTAFGLLVLGALRLAGARRATALAAAVACLAVSGPLRAEAARRRGGLEVIFLSVGQGDCALLRLPDGSAVLIDGGGAPEGGADPGERDVVPLLRDLGVTQLAAVFVSHPHPDHVLGLRAVGEAVAVDLLFTNGRTAYGDSADALDALPSPIVLEPGDGWQRAGVRFDAVGGPRGSFEENDASLVLRVQYGATTFLFPGDVEEAGEAAAAAAGGLSATVVKVAHHGSRRSSTAPFVRAVHPRFAVVNHGRGNRYGFPHGEALSRWRAAGAEVVQTVDGAARFLSDGVTVRRVAADDVLDPLAMLRERGLGTAPAGAAP
jgi:competence protein ComEC